MTNLYTFSRLCQLICHSRPCWSVWRHAALSFLSPIWTLTPPCPTAVPSAKMCYSMCFQDTVIAFAFSMNSWDTETKWRFHGHFSSWLYTKVKSQSCRVMQDFWPQYEHAALICFGLLMSSASNVLWCLVLPHLAASWTSCIKENGKLRPLMHEVLLCGASYETKKWLTALTALVMPPFDFPFAPLSVRMRKSKCPKYKEM